MAKFGVISNQNSRQNRNKKVNLGNLEKIVKRSGGRQIITTDLSELPTAIAEFKRAGIDIIASNSGDGGEQRLATEIKRQYAGETEPMQLPLAGGTQYLIARYAGMTRAGRWKRIFWGESMPESILSSYVEQLKDVHPDQIGTIKRKILKVEKEGEEPEYGFMFASGLPYNFLKKYYGNDFNPFALEPSTAKFFNELARSIYSMMMRGISRRARKYYEDMRRSTELELMVEGERLFEGSADGFGASAIPINIVMFKPFHRMTYSAHLSDGMFQLLGGRFTIPSLVWRLHRFMMNRPADLGDEYIDRKIREFTIVPKEEMGYTLDGEMYKTKDIIKVSAQETVRFPLLGTY